MSKNTLERQLEVIIFLLENLPKKICDEIDARNEIKKYKETGRFLEEREAKIISKELELDA